MFVKSIIAGILFGFLAYIFFFYYNIKQTSVEDDLEQNIILSWKNKVKFPATRFRKLAVGINSNVDYIVPGLDLLKKLGLTPGDMKDHKILLSLNELQETFFHFFAKGSAAERVYDNPDVFGQIRQTAESLDTIEQYIGGNAALIAAQTAALFPNVKILFVGPVGPQLRSLMPDAIEIPESSRIASDEVHLIMEYQVGDSWGGVVTTVANRFISSYDESNSQLTMLDTFFEGVNTFQPDLIVISGLHLLDGQAAEFSGAKVRTLVAHLQAVPHLDPIHLEFASMTNQAFVKQLVHEVLPNIDSLGLNEQELFVSSAACGGPHSSDLGAEGQPVIHKVTDIILWLLKTFGQSETHPQSRLTRIHFHSLTYHIIGTKGLVWNNIQSAVAAGASRASHQACDVEELNSDIVDIKIPLRYKLFTGDEERDFNSSEPVTYFTREGYHFAFSPVLVCKKPLKTVGLGDAISATGLMYSEFMVKNTHLYGDDFF
ncbi:ADP-dependent glucokinase-like [Gigantopelta aegis]|uniref:ADP-dependent glucokinase-like n=1 Tax=Gigantopelta aegis TaxID=1735272 RepID=UPI001B88C1D2|nr:ADP-dependent glucokinase-like [Gigantopelta aegis]